MPRELGSGRPLGLACVALLLGACGTADDSSPAAAEISVSPTTWATSSMQHSGAVSLTPTADSGSAGLLVNDAQGWSIVVPTGWKVVANGPSGTALTRNEAIGEIFVGPSSGLSLDELQARNVDEVTRSWQGVIGDIESDFVSLPAGDALRLTFETGLETDSPGIFTSYVIEEGDTQYVISVRGSQDDDDLLAAAEALAESFAILE